MNLLCSIFGHKNVIKDWYPHDPVVTLACDRCRKILDQKPNPGFVSLDYDYSSLVPPYQEIRRGIMNNPFEEAVRVFSPSDPYGEEIWNE